MAKISKTYTIEEETLNIVRENKEDRNLSSDSASLERIVLEWAVLKGNNNGTSNVHSNIDINKIQANENQPRTVFNEEKIEELRKQKESKQKPSSSGVVVEGIDNCLVKLSKCCNPLPGDEIIGYITKGRGVSVHRKDCVNVKDLLTEENRIIDVKWYEEAKENYNVTLEVLANDRKGLLVDILNTVKETKANLMGVSTKTTKERIAIMEIDLEVENIEELNKVIRNIKKVDSVYEVRR